MTTKPIKGRTMSTHYQATAGVGVLIEKRARERRASGKLLSDAETNALIVAAASAHGTATKDQISEVLHWAGVVRIDGILLDLVASGDVVVRMVDGEPEFREATPEESAAILRVVQGADRN